VPRERKYVFYVNMLQLSVGGRRKPPSRKLSGLQPIEGRDAEEEVAEGITTGRVFSSNLAIPGMFLAAAL
jgi:hypothetical protein